MNIKSLPIYVFLFLLPLLTFSQRKNKSEVVTQHIAHITYDSVLINLKGYPKSLKLLEAYQNQLVSEYELKTLEFEAAVEEFQSKAESWTELEQDEKALAIQRQRDELQNLESSFQEKLRTKERELLTPLNEKINTAIQHVAKTKNFTHVVEKKNFYYIHDSFDITNWVIEEANK